MDDRANVLIVDDEEIVRRSYASALAQGRWSARAAADGGEAMRAMESQRFDVVLLDVRMPGDDGLAVLREMKRRWPEREVVVITGYPSVEAAKEAVRLGAHDYLAKPLDAEAIAHAARGALERKRWAIHAAEEPVASRHQPPLRSYP